MSITLFGVISILILAICFFLPLRYSLRLVIISAIFQASSVFDIGDKGIYLLLIAEGVFILKVLLFTSWKRNLLKINERKKIWVIFWWAFVIIAVLGAFFLPILFEGTYVQAGGASTIKDITPLKFSSKNLIQVVTLLINSITVYLVFKMRELFDKDFIIKSFLYAIGIVLFIGFWEYLYKMNIIPIKFPTEFLYNNDGYKQLFDQNTRFGLKRMNATFLEASYCGAFLAASFWGCISLKNKTSNILAVLLLIAIVCNFSGTGVVTFALGGVVFMMLGNNRKKLVYFGVVFFIVIFIMSQTGLLDIFVEMIVGKMDSTSGNVRSDTNIFSLKLVLDTFGLGVGIGSHRSYSFIINMLALVGVLGTILWGISMWYLFMPIYRRRKVDNTCNFILIYFIVLLIGQCLAIPDLSFSPFWMGLIVAVAIDTKKIDEEQEKQVGERNEIVG